MNTMQIECFLAAARHLNFGRAATELCISQPAVSHQISALEKELGAKLFYRTTRSVELTQSGLEFLDDAKSIYSIASHALARFANPDSAEVKTLTIGCSGSINSSFLSDILSKTMKNHGYFQPFITKTDSSQIVARIAEGALDAAFSFESEDFEDEFVKFKPMRSCGFVCLIKKDDPLTFKQSVSTDDLKSRHIILCRYGSVLSEAVKTRQLLTGERKPSDVILCENSHDVRVLVRSGFGVGIIPEIYADESDDVAIIKLSDLKALTFGVFYRKGDESTLVKDLVKFALSDAQIYL